MTRYALVDPEDSIVRLSSSVNPGVDTKTGFRWLQCDPVERPSFDPKAEKVTGPTYSVGGNSVTEAWAVVSLSVQEISDAKDSAISGINGSWSPVLRAFYNIESRLRVLESKPSITFQQFKTGLKQVLD